MRRTVVWGVSVCALLLPVAALAQHGLDLSGRNANFDEVRLRSGFGETRTVRGRTGGAVDATPLADGCGGWIARRPDHIVHLRSEFAHLRLYVESDADTSLVVRTPQGQWICATGGHGDDGQIARDGWAAGRYLVWIGGPTEGEAAPYRLQFTEARAGE